ncbi:MAG: 1,4-beta-xylanase [Cellulomonas sp. 73-92]|uniref:endo-1,4-beta-xylanase n=1 Tax=Cellulomonas sp. 73-92 TaxID=1895740 RepID=UPI000928E385|nr:endo-1,4-beta-xylanase [Cellulomonas sp. 73-92]OJV81551.1 MAG: 1,4-beta-xylanase [Cellulomonas sp. 73-92]
MPEVVVRCPAELAHRTARTDVTVTGADGRPLAGAEVTVAQRRHAFTFGNIGFDLVALANDEPEAGPDGGGAHHHLARLAELWLDLFNTATLPFYWRRFEPERGRPDTARLLRGARWFRDRGVALKGHPLAWHTQAPQWLLPLSDDEVEAALRARITRDVTDFAGLVDTWDAINEVVILPVFTAEENAVTRLARREGRLGMVRLAFDTARAANPGTTLLLNDFDLSERYERLVEECLEAGVRIDALGLQSHMHQGYWGEEKTQRILERFARFGLPLHWTETTLVSGHLMPPEIDDLNDYQVPDWPTTPQGEERQADELVRHYRTLLAHPAVQAVTYWGLTDDGSWLGAPAGLVRRDGTAKPAYDALHAHVKGEWWLPETTVRTDDAGRFTLDAFLGDYTVTAAGSSAEVTLAAGTPVAEARLS